MLPIDRVLNAPSPVNIFAEDCSILSTRFEDLAKDEFDEGRCYLVGVIEEAGKFHIFDGKAIYKWTHMSAVNPFTQSPATKVHYFATNQLIHENRFCFVATQYLKYYHAHEDQLIRLICEDERKLELECNIHELIAHFLDREDDPLHIKLAQGFFYEITNQKHIDPYYSCLFEYLGDEEILDLEGLRESLLERVDEAAQFCLASLCWSGLGGTVDYPTARVLFKKLAKLGNFRAQWMYGKMVYEGIGGRRGSRKALSYLKKSAIQEFAEAQYLYAKLLDQRPHNYLQALEIRKFYQLAAHQGHAIASYQYAALAFRDSVTTKFADVPVENSLRRTLYEQIGRRYIQRSASYGYCTAQYMLAYLAYHGDGGPRDLPMAREFFKRAGDQNSADAQFRFAMMAFFGEGGPRDPEIAKEYLELARPTVIVSFHPPETLPSRRMSL